MGDRIKIKKIELLYKHLWQIDLYNETKDEHYRVFVEEQDLIEMQNKAKDIKE